MAAQIQEYAAHNRPGLPYENSPLEHLGFALSSGNYLTISYCMKFVYDTL